MNRLTLTASMCRLLAVAGVMWGSNFATAAESPAAPQPAPPPDRKIAANDVLQISITGESGLQTSFRVSSGRSIQYPFLGLVRAVGLTPAEFQARLRQELMKDYFVDPQILVTVASYRQDFVSVLGMVSRPGPVPLTGERKLEILDAIAMAGGTSRLAKDRIEWTHEGVTRKLSLDALKKVKDPEKKIWLSPGDIIQVTERVF